MEHGSRLVAVMASLFLSGAGCSAILDFDSLTKGGSDGGKDYKTEGKKDTGPKAELGPDVGAPDTLGVDVGAKEAGVDQKVVDQKVVDQKVVDQKVVDQKVIDQKVVDQKVITPDQKITPDQPVVTPDVGVPCGPITFTGCCSGSVLKYCSGSTLSTIDCTFVPSCGWDTTLGRYFCGTTGNPYPGDDAGGSFPMACP